MEAFYYYWFSGGTDFDEIDPNGLIGGIHDSWTEANGEWTAFDHADYEISLEGAIANCRDLWDENSVGDVYCCQMIGDVWEDTPNDAERNEAMSVEIVIGSTATYEGPGEYYIPWDDYEDYDEYDEWYDWVTFSAEVFKSSKALTGAMATVAATAMVFIF